MSCLFVQPLNSCNVPYMWSRQRKTTGQYGKWLSPLLVCVLVTPNNITLNMLPVTSQVPELFSRERWWSFWELTSSAQAFALPHVRILRLGINGFRPNNARKQISLAEFYFHSYLCRYVSPIHYNTCEPQDASEGAEADRKVRSQGAITDQLLTDDPRTALALLPFCHSHMGLISGGCSGRSHSQQ